MRPLRRSLIAALSVCAVTPALARILPASAPFSSASATSSRSTVTKESPALSRDLLGVVEQPRGGRREIELAPRPSPAPSAACRARVRPAASASFERPPALSIRPAREPFLVVEQHLEDMLGRELLMSLAQAPAIARSE